MEEKVKKNWPLTVAPELHEIWKKLRRRNDPEVMAKELGVSRPIIDRALIYGNVTMEGVVEKINDFFENRLKKERETATRLGSFINSDPEPTAEAQATEA